MTEKNIRSRELHKEFKFNTSRSGGPGGQHANKVETNVELRFNINESKLLSQDEKERLIQKLSSKLTKEEELIITSDSKRSQVQNKYDAIEKFYATIEKALKKPKKRKKTKPPKAAKEKRIQDKKKHSEKKSQRKPPKLK
ncbi:MAG: alternative ribosome rescue aminoacyl-tRNA hydrolase ArfB [Bacteroidales bacterium]